MLWPVSQRVKLSNPCADHLHFHNYFTIRQLLKAARGKCNIFASKTQNETVCFSATKYINEVVKRAVWQRVIK